MKERMEQGELSVEPEIEARNDDQRKKQSTFTQSNSRQKSKSKSQLEIETVIPSKVGSKPHVTIGPVEEDDFFDIDEDMDPASDTADNESE